MNILKIKNYKFSEYIHFENTDDSIIICNKLDNNLYDFNSVGKSIIELLQNSYSIDSILDKLSKEYVVEKSLIMPDVQEFIDSLIEKGILIVE